MSCRLRSIFRRKDQIHTTVILIVDYIICHARNAVRSAARGTLWSLQLLRIFYPRSTRQSIVNVAQRRFSVE
jgi:hypothetical protein